jgi:hypothetical protein
MRQKNLISRAQSRAILHVMATPPDEEAEKELGALIVEEGPLTQGTLDACLSVQKKMLDEYFQPPRLALLLVEKKLATDQAVLAALRALNRKGKGLLAELETAVKSMKESTDEEDPVAPEKRQIVIVSVLLVCAAALALFLLVQGGKSPPMQTMDGICERCNTVIPHIRVRPDAIPPFNCEKCRAETVYPAARCLKCKTVFALKFSTPANPTQPCPKCGSMERARVR